MHPAIAVRENSPTGQLDSTSGMEALNVLLVSTAGNGTEYLREQLESRGCRCWSANSSEDLTAMANRQAFDLILSTSWLRDQTLSKLQDSNSTVFVSYPVRNGCWWLPVLERGRCCLGEPAMRGNEFADRIGQWLRRIGRMNATAA